MKSVKLLSRKHVLIHVLIQRLNRVVFSLCFSAVKRSVAMLHATVLIQNITKYTYHVLITLLYSRCTSTIIMLSGSCVVNKIYLVSISRVVVFHQQNYRLKSYCMLLFLGDGVVLSPYWCSSAMKGFFRRV